MRSQSLVSKPSLNLYQGVDCTVSFILQYNYTLHQFHAENKHISNMGKTAHKLIKSRGKCHDLFNYCCLPCQTDINN